MSENKPKKMTKKAFEEMKLNIKEMYELAETQSDFNSINKEYRTETFTGNLIEISEFSGKYGTTTRYSFQTENKDNWSLLSSSSILAKVASEIALFTKCEVYKNEKGHWRIMPYLE